MKMHMEFRNDLPLPIAVRFLVTKLGNFYVDIEMPEMEQDPRYTIIESKDYDVLEVQPE